MIEFTPAGLAALVLIYFLIRGGTGRIGVVIAAVCGAAIGIFGTLGALVWSLGEQGADLANTLGSGF